ncbi:MAG: J domain-containing protein [Saprospiraceae bacterium]
MKDYYYILGLKKEATSQEIKKAYKKLSLKFHPDQNGGDDFFADRFKEIQEAYETLSEEGKKRIYDTTLNKQSSTNPKQQGANNFLPVIEYFKSNSHTVKL